MLLVGERRGEAGRRRRQRGLREERLVVDVEVVPVERVRVSVGDVTETVRVAEDVRVERVELDAPERSPR